MIIQIKRIICAALALLMILCSFAACGGTAEGDITTEPETSAPAETEAPGMFDDNGEKTLILTGRETLYGLTRADSTSDEIIEIYKEITRSIRNKCENTITGSTDWIIPNTDPEKKCEILLGNTNREATRLVMDAIGYDDYAVVKVNSKIVIAAHTEARLKQAVGQFLSMLTYEGTGKDAMVYFSGAVWEKGNGEFLMGEDNRLEDYSVVCAAGNPVSKESAEIFIAQLKKAFGAELPLTFDSAAPAEREIVIGMCDREICRKYLTDSESTEYIIAADGRTLLIGSRDDYFNKLAVSKFCSRYVNNYYSNTFTLAKDVLKRDTSFTFADPNEFLNGGDLRIMSFNILCEKWNDKLPVEGRDSTVAATVMYYSPDVVGLQEVSDAWYKALDKLLGETYVFTDRKTTQGATNFSTLAYNVNKVKLLEHGVQLFTQGNNPQLRLVTWGLFEKLDTGKKFIAVSTHWDLGSNPQYQMVHSEEMAAFVLDMEKKYGVPVVTTGDYNSKESTQPYINFVNKTGYKEAKYTAGMIKRACVTYHSVGTAPSSANANSIDHIFASSGFAFTYFNVLVDPIIVLASDHCPIYADLKFN